MEDGAVVEAVVHVAQEVLDRGGGLLRKELDGDVAQRRLDDDERILGVGYCLLLWRRIACFG